MTLEVSVSPAGARETRPWATPVRPVEDGRLWCVWEAGGVYEWFAHPNHAAYLLEQGIRIDGQLCKVDLIDVWPGLGVQIRAVKR